MDEKMNEIINENDFHMKGKLVQTSMGCVGVSKETVVNLEISWYTMLWRMRYESLNQWNNLCPG